MLNWDSLNKISCLITIVTGIVSFMLGVNLQKFKKKLEYRRIKNNPSRNAGVLIVSIGKNDIENQVKSWLKQKNGYSDIPNESILKVEKISDNISVKDVETIMNDLKKKKLKLQHKGINKVHLFVAAPVAVAEMIGAELSNNFVTMVYQHNFNSEEKYELWGLLQK